MAKNLTDGTVKVTGVKTTADRTVCMETVTYSPHGKSWDCDDVNALVYDMMTIACYDMMSVGDVLYSGDYTAAEMAGKIGCLHQYTEGGEYMLVKIKTKTFCCTYHAGEAFVQMAEWEGVSGILPKNYHRFSVDGKERPKDMKIEPYKRCHGYRPTTVSLAAENTRLNRKFDVIGPMYEVLGSDGMKRAMAVSAAASCFDNMSYEWRSMVKDAMRWKLWKDYGTFEPLRRRHSWLSAEMERADQKSERYKAMKKELDEIEKKYVSLSRPIDYSSSDFICAPEVWKQVDRKYAASLVSWFQQMLRDHPAPEWPKQGDVVVFKGADKMQKKYQRKFLCEGLVASLTGYGCSIEWRASLCVGKFKNEYFLPGQLEPAPEKPKKKAKAKKAEPEHGPEVSPKREPVRELTRAERLRAVLLQQLKRTA